MVSQTLVDFTKVGRKRKNSKKGLKSDKKGSVTDQNKSNTVCLEWKRNLVEPFLQRESSSPKKTNPQKIDGMNVAGLLAAIVLSFSPPVPEQVHLSVNSSAAHASLVVTWVTKNSSNTSFVKYVETVRERLSIFPVLATCR